VAINAAAAVVATLFFFESFATARYVLPCSCNTASTVVSRV